MSNFNKYLDEDFGNYRDEIEREDVQLLLSSNWEKALESPHATFWRPRNEPQNPGIRCDVAANKVRSQLTKS